MAPMSFYSKEILQAIDYIIEDGTYSWDKISEADREYLTATCINSLPNAMDLFIYDNPNLEKALYKVKNFLQNGMSENAIDLMTLLADGAVKTASISLEEVFHERADLYLTERKREAGYRPVMNEQNGDTIWIK